MLVNLRATFDLIHLPSKVEAARKPLTFKRRVLFDRIIIGGIYLAGIITAIAVS